MLQLPIRPGSAQIWEHDDGRELVLHFAQRFTRCFLQTALDNRDDRTHNSLRRQRGDLRGTLALQATLVHHLDHAIEDLLTPLQHPLRATRALHHTQPRELRLTIKEREDYPQARADALTPLQLG